MSKKAKHSLIDSELAPSGHRIVPPDVITLLRSKGGYRKCCKRLRDVFKSSDAMEPGDLPTKQYDNVKFVEVHERRVDGIRGLHNLLSKCAKRQDLMLIRGGFCGLDIARKQWDPAAENMRLPSESRAFAADSSDHIVKCNINFPDRLSNFVMIDFDGLDVPAPVRAEGIPAMVRWAIEHCLPAEFHTASYVYQLSTSSMLLDRYGRSNPKKPLGTLCAHIFFWLATPTYSAPLKAFFSCHIEKLKADGMDSKLDLALFQETQAHYICTPVFDKSDAGGIVDPHPDGRVFFVERETDVVDIGFLASEIEKDAEKHAAPKNGKTGNEGGARTDFDKRTLAMESSATAVSAAAGPRVQVQRERVVGRQSSKPAEIGDVCRAYPIELLIEEHLSDIYRIDAPGRYTYLHSASGAPESAYEMPSDAELLGTSSGSDPIHKLRGHCANAFDLVRVHRYRHLDQGFVAGPDTRPSDYPSYREVCKWAATDKRVIAAKKARPPRKASPAASSNPATTAHQEPQKTIPMPANKSMSTAACAAPASISSIKKQTNAKHEVLMDVTVTQTAVGSTLSPGMSDDCIPMDGGIDMDDFLTAAYSDEIHQARLPDTENGKNGKNGKMPEASILAFPTRNSAADPAQAPEYVPHFKFLSSSDMDELPDLEWLVQDVIPEEGLAVVWGPTGCGKSFLMLDMIGAISRGDPWFGIETKKKKVIYMCLEGEGGLKKRQQAYKTVHGAKSLENVNFTLQPYLMLTEHSDKLALDIKHCFGTGLVVVIDTLNQATPGMDESSIPAMGILIATAKKLREEIGGTVILVHHAGKDLTRGMRGASNLPAALDAAIKVTRDTNNRRFWEASKVKDEDDNQGHEFRLGVLTLGQDKNGRPIRSCHIEPMAAAEMPSNEKSGLGKNQKLVLGVLSEMLGDGTQAVQIDDLIARAKDMIDVAKKHQGDRAKDAVASLIKSRHIVCTGNMISIA
jgi:hypothetical protein